MEWTFGTAISVLGLMVSSTLAAMIVTYYVITRKRWGPRRSVMAFSSVWSVSFAVQVTVWDLMTVPGVRAMCLTALLFGFGWSLWVGWNQIRAARAARIGQRGGNGLT